VQKRLRMGVAIFGIAFAVFVYFAIGERTVPPPPRPVERVDPKAVLESNQATLRQTQRTEREFEVAAERTLSYEDGSVKYTNATITAHRPDGRQFVITAQEASAGPKQVELQLDGGVSIAASDGFRMLTEHGTFNRDDSIARAKGEVTFSKGLMSGSGLGASYDERNDVLTIAERAQVTVREHTGQVALDGHADAVTLDRLNDVLFLNSGAHVVRGTQVIDADRAMARLSSNEEVIRHLELRGHARVHGGDNSIESMSAAAIDLDYSDDGAALERVILNTDAQVVTADGEASGRQIKGDALDMLLAPDGAVTGLTGRGGVRLDLPAVGNVPGRSISGQTLDATGEPGKGITAVRFKDNVIFQEAGAGSAGRDARAQSLNAILDGDQVSNAFFSGGVTFTDRTLRAAAAEVRYQPTRGILNLSGTASGGLPSVSDEQIRVDARTIDVTLDGHGMEASGRVRTTLGAAAKAGAKGPDGQSGRLPGLLRQGEPASVNAETLTYSGARGRAVYAGGATLVQGDTAIRGDTIVLDQQNGDLIATGSARSTLVLDAGRTDGRAHEIRYEEEARLVTYSAAPIAPTTGRGPGSATAGPPTATGSFAQLSGPDGDLRASRIQIVLAREGNQVDRLEAYTNVTMTLGSRTAVGTRLTYYARDERYVMSSDDATPVTIRESCRETTGRTLTFFKSTDRVIVDGNDTRRTETKPCTSPSAR